jgi:membrane protein
MKFIFFLPFRLFYAVINDFFGKKYTYHASAIAFSFFLVLNAIVIFLGTILKYVPNKRALIEKIYQIFPHASEQVVSELVALLEKLSFKVQLITLVLIVAFIGNFLRTLEIAFSYIADAPLRKIPWVHYVLPFLFAILLTLYGSVDIALKVAGQLLEKLHLMNRLTLEVLHAVKIGMDYLLFPVGLTSIYYFISPVRLNLRITLAVSLFVVLVVNPLKGLFTWYVTHFLTKNLVITPFAGILVFLVWLYLLSLIILIGYRIILLLQGWNWLKTEKLRRKG